MAQTRSLSNAAASSSKTKTLPPSMTVEPGQNTVPPTRKTNKLQSGNKNKSKRVTKNRIKHAFTTPVKNANKGVIAKTSSTSLGKPKSTPRNTNTTKTVLFPVSDSSSGEESEGKVEVKHVATKRSLKKPANSAKLNRGKRMKTNQKSIFSLSDSPTDEDSQGNESDSSSDELSSISCSSSKSESESSHSGLSEENSSGSGADTETEGEEDDDHDDDHLGSTRTYKEITAEIKATFFLNASSVPDNTVRVGSKPLPRISVEIITVDGIKMYRFRAYNTYGLYDFDIFKAFSEHSFPQKENFKNGKFVQYSEKEASQYQYSRYIDVPVKVDERTRNDIKKLKLLQKGLEAFTASSLAGFQVPLILNFGVDEFVQTNLKDYRLVNKKLWCFSTCNKDLLEQVIRRSSRKSSQDKDTQDFLNARAHIGRYLLSVGHGEKDNNLLQMAKVASENYYSRAKLENVFIKSDFGDKDINRLRWSHPKVKLFIGKNGYKTMNEKSSKNQKKSKNKTRKHRK